MNKTRIIGIGLFSIGVITGLTFDNEVSGLFSGILIGFGIGIFIKGRFKKSDKPT